jgi:pectate lyase
MKTKINVALVIGLVILAITSLEVLGQQLAFPGAQGFGAYSTGGRGGAIYHITTLNDSGPGSFRDAVSKPNRTIVFDIGGVITIKSKILVSSKITIAGQTAPGEGIVIYGNGVTFSGASNVIVRNVRFHGSINMARGGCVVAVDHASDVILDHCSINWGRWDNLHIKDSKDVTLQYCINGESIDPQRFGALLEDPDSLTIHHCLWIDNQSRNPKAKAGIQFINNVVYNYGKNGLVGGHSGALHYQDIINNYFIAGPNSSANSLGMFTETDHVYHRGNMIDLNKDGVLNGVAIQNTDFKVEGAAKSATFESAPHQPCPIAVTEESAEDAYKTVLAKAGPLLHRDAVELRLIAQVKSLGKEGHIIKDENEVGGQTEVVSGKTPLDSDGDGIPDAWEIAHKLNPKDANDANIIAEGGYSNLENYLNSLLQ